MNDSEWRRLALPKRWMFVLLAVLVGLVLVVKLAVTVCFLNFLDPEIRVATHIDRVFDGGIAAICCMFVGVCLQFRFQRFPRRSSKYRRWLSRTRWTADRRLPFGPWTPIREDLGILAVLSAVIACGADPVLSVGPWLVYGAAWFLVGFSAGLLAHPRVTYAFTVIVLVLTHLMMFDSPLAAVVLTLVLGLAITLAVLGYRSLVHELQQLTKESLEETAPSNLESVKDSVHHALHGEPRFPTRWPVWQGLAVAVLVFLAFSLPSWQLDGIQGDVPLLALLSMLFVTGMILTRIGLFANSAASFGWSARWAMRRWIVPEHDVVYVAPAAMLFVGAVFAFLGHHHYLPPRVGYPLGIAVVSMLGLCLGPDHKDWVLIAPARIRLRTRRGKVANRLLTSLSAQPTKG